jgi:hypothetical protein
MSGDTDSAQAATETLNQMGARVVEDRGKVLLIDLAEAPIGDDDLSILCNYPYRVLPASLQFRMVVADDWERGCVGRSGVGYDSLRR